MSGTIIRLELSLDAQQKLEAKMAELGKEEFLKQLSESVGYPVTDIEKVSSKQETWLDLLAEPRISSEPAMQFAKPSLISIVYQCLSFIVMCGFVGWCLASLLC